MNMRQPDHTTFRELLYLEPDGELNAGDRSRLKQHLDVCSDCRRERQELAVFNELVRDTVIPVDEQFTQTVMEGLPAAGWRPGHLAPGWRHWLWSCCSLSVGRC